MMDLQDMPVTLVIKAPNQRMEDLTVDCMLGWTIRKLKQHLETVYPSKPKENEQRLIYFGKLLQDHLTLKEILRQDDGEDAINKHTVHLVCSNLKASSSSFSASQKAKEKAVSKPSSSLPPSSPSPLRENVQHPTNTDTQGDGLRFRGQASDVPTNPQFYTAGQMSYPQTSTTYQYSPEQYNWMIQQQYYAQYMMQYMQYYQGMYAATGQPFVGLPTTTAAPPFPQPQQQQAQQQENQQQAPQPPAGAGNNAPRQNMRMNAQGGMEEDDDEEMEQRDWLHHTYFLMRLLTFLGILFFYSSFSRFLMVFAGSFAIYFFQKLRKYMQRAQRERERQQEQAQQQQPNDDLPEQQQQQQHQEEQQQQQQELPQDAANQTPSGNLEQSEEDEASIDQSDWADGRPETVEENGNRVTRLFMFVSRTIQLFFTSLVPAPAELLEAN